MEVSFCTFPREIQFLNMDNYDQKKKKSLIHAKIVKIEYVHMSSDYI